MKLEECLITEKPTSVDKKTPEVEDEFDKLSTYPIWCIFTLYVDPLEIASIDFESVTDENKER